MISFDCPSCGKRLAVPEAAAGRSRKCAGCGLFVRVPAPQARKVVPTEVEADEVDLGQAPPRSRGLADPVSESVIIVQCLLCKKKYPTSLQACPGCGAPRFTRTREQKEARAREKEQKVQKGIRGRKQAGWAAAVLAALVLALGGFAAVNVVQERRQRAEAEVRDREDLREAISNREKSRHPMSPEERAERERRLRQRYGH